MTLLMVIVWLYNFFILTMWLLVASNSGLLLSMAWLLPTIVSIVGGFHIKRYKNIMPAAALLVFICLALEFFTSYLNITKFQFSFEMFSSFILQLIAIILNSIVFPLAARRAEFK
jgi:hypothetical protein